MSGPARGTIKRPRLPSIARPALRKPQKPKKPKRTLMFFRGGPFDGKQTILEAPESGTLVFNVNGWVGRYANVDGTLVWRTE